MGGKKRNVRGLAKKGLKEEDEVKDLFGEYPMGNIQKIKDELRKDWVDADKSPLSQATDIPEARRRQ